MNEDAPRATAAQIESARERCNVTPKGNLDVYVARLKARETLMTLLRNQLQDRIAEGTVKDPALFWAGKMSLGITRLCLSSAVHTSDIIFELRLISDEYDAVILGRVNLETGNKPPKVLDNGLPDP